MYEQTFKNIDDKLHKDAGCSSELDYVEQTSWILFLKYLDDLEHEKRSSAELSGKTYQPIIVLRNINGTIGLRLKTKKVKSSSLLSSTFFTLQ
jgi:hypothetical protein